MIAFDNPRDDPIVRDLKQGAINGLERGPMFDQGVLFVIMQIERNGCYSRKHPFLILLDCGNPPDIERCLLSPEEKLQLKKSLDSLRMTPVEGVAFARGILYADNLVGNYRDKDA